jgi:hypothetical protein
LDVIHERIFIVQRLCAHDAAELIDRNFHI